MKKKLVYYTAIIFITGFILNFIVSFGINVWGISEAVENDKKSRETAIPYEEWIKQEQYRNYYKPTIDSLLVVNPASSIKYIDKIISKYPKEYYLEFQKGLAYYNIDSFVIAHHQFRKAIKKSEISFPKARQYSGYSLAQLGRYDEAIAELKIASEINASYTYDIAFVYEMKKDTSNAIKYYKIDLKNLKKSNSTRYRYAIEELEAKISELGKRNKI